MTIDPDNPLGLSTTALEEVDRLCVQFERGWQLGERPEITDYLARASDEKNRSALLQELLLLEIDYRRSRGESPACAEYTSTFPSDAVVIETVFAGSGETDQLSSPTDAAVPRSSDTSPKQMGRYRILERVGEGGFGIVYRAHDDQLQRDIAIKVPHRHLARRVAAFDLFRQEARAVATLRHPAIVPVYDVHFDEDDPSSSFVVCEFMAGGDLSSAEELPMAPLRAAGVVQRLARALHHAHHHGLVHRDVKLSNVLRDADGNVFIADFGLALREQEVGCGGGFAGTPANMSPEQARGTGHLVDGRTDVYGLGVVLYQLLTGRRPFEQEDVASLLEAIQHRDPRPPRQIDDEIPAELERIALRALAKQPADRYPTALDMAEDVARWQRRQSAAAWPGRPLLLAAAAAVLLVAGWVLLSSRSTSATQNIAVTPPVTPIRTLAVLPFQPVAQDAQMDYLGWGLADSLITRLSNLRQIVVRPTDAIREYVDGDSDPVTTGKHLQVDAVLQGSIQQTSDRTRMRLRLVRVADGALLWAQTFDEDSVDLFAVQDAISEHVIRALTLQLTAQDRKRLGRQQTENRQAFEAYIKARYHWNQRSLAGPKEIRQAIKHFQAAIDTDPTYALAYAGLAECYAVLNVYTGTLDPEALPRARAAAKRALEIDDELTEAHTTLAYVTMNFDWDWDQAERQFRRAIELNPNYATAHQWYGELLQYSLRFDEAVVQFQRAAELDPLSTVIKDMQASPYLWRRDYERARQEYAKAVELHGGSVLSNYGLAVCCEQEKKYEQALEYYRRQGYRPGQAYALGKLGRVEEVREMRDELLQWQPHQAYPYHIATTYLGTEEYDQALDWLEKAKQQRDEHLVWLQVDAKLDPLRKHPRFLQLLKDVGWVQPPE